MGSAVAALFREGLPDPAIVRRMLEATPHRGSVFGIVIHGSCVLGVSRPPDVDEAQIASEDGLAAAVSGKIDNLEDLAAELIEPREHGPPARSPASLLIAAFKVLGDEMPNRLRGLYAVVITDGSKLWCFRDHLGFRALFYRNEPSRFFAGSEIKQVIAGADISREPDLDVLEQIFYGTYDDDTPCALEGVLRLPKSTLLRTSSTRATMSTDRYWDPESLLETGTLSFDEVHCRFEELMTRAVARNLNGNDVVSLSGGIDSPAIAGFAAPLSRGNGAPVAALSALFPHLPSVDEREYIEAVATHLGMALHTYVPKARPLERLEYFVGLLDGPVPTVALEDIEEYYQVARDLGFTTILEGQVAEFVFDMREYLKGHLLLHWRLGAVARHVRRETSVGASWIRVLYGLTREVLPTPLAKAHARIRRGGLRVPEWMNAPRMGMDCARYVVGPRERWRDQQLKGFIGPGLTIEADEICQNLYGVQARRPWADVDLWEFFLSLPAEVKFPDTQSKTLVRGLLRGRVPEVILDRRGKTLFTDFTMARVNYPVLRKCLSRPQHRMADVDYDILAAKLDREDLDPLDLRWAKDLAAIHAFLDLW